MEKMVKLDGVTPKNLKDLFIAILNHCPNQTAFWDGCREDWEFEDRTNELEEAVFYAFYHANGEE